MNNTPVFLLHGLGSHPWTLWPLQWYLMNVKHYVRVYCLSYPVDQLDWEDTLDYVDREMSRWANKTSESVILIGQSMGGVVSNHMHEKGWNVKQAIYIGSPLKGARILHRLNRWLPRAVRDLMFKKPYGILMTKDQETKPPHPFHTISLGWFWSDFDGCVFRDEATLDDTHHTHLACADHRTIFANPRLWKYVGQWL